MIKRMLEKFHAWWLSFPRLNEYHLTCQKCHADVVVKADGVIWSVATGYPMHRDGKRVPCPKDCGGYLY